MLHNSFNLSMQIAALEAHAENTSDGDVPERMLLKVNRDTETVTVGHPSHDFHYGLQPLFLAAHDLQKDYSKSTEDTEVFFNNQWNITIGPDVESNRLDRFACVIEQWFGDMLLTSSTVRGPKGLCFEMLHATICANAS
jgi:hypothetical protein